MLDYLVVEFKRTKILCISKSFYQNMEISKLSSKWKQVFTKTHKIQIHEVNCGHCGIQRKPNFQI